MIRTCFVCLLLLGPATTLAARQPAPGDDPDSRLAQAMELHEAGDIMGAIDGYTAVLRADPGRADARSNLGAAYVRLGRFQEAVDQYRQALLQAPDNASFRFNLALAYYKAGRYAEAVPELEAVVKADAANRAAPLVLGDTLLQLGEYQRAIDLLILRDAAFPDDLAFGYILGTALLKQGHREQAQVYLDRIFKAGESAEGHVLLGTAYIEARDYAGAIAVLQKALALNSQVPGARTLYARALLGSGDTAAAAREFGRALQANPNDFDANLQLGGLRRRDQDNDAALVYLERAVRLRPGDPTARFGLAGTHLALGNPDEARDLLEKLVADVPDYEEGHVMLATCYYRLKRKDDGDRHRAIAERLRAERQARQPKPENETAPNPAGDGGPPSE